MYPQIVAGEARREPGHAVQRRRSAAGAADASFTREARWA
jgi:hypothetical protein